MFDIAEQSLSGVVRRCQSLFTTASNNVEHGAVASADVGTRPVFLPELGKFIKKLRDSRGWTIRGAASMAQRRGLKTLNYQQITALEHGKTKNPEPAVLRALAELYGLPSEDLIERFTAERLGGGRSQTTSDRPHLQKPLKGHSHQGPEGAPDAQSPARLIADLEARLATYESLFAALRRLTDDASRLLAAGRSKSAAALRTQSKRSSHR